MLLVNLFVRFIGFYLQSHILILFIIHYGVAYDISSCTESLRQLKQSEKE